MIKVSSDIRIAFEQLGIKFQSMVQGHQDEINGIVQSAIDNFDFETVITAHVQNKIELGLEDAFSEIDLKEEMKRRIWVEIERKLEAK